MCHDAGEGENRVLPGGQTGGSFAWAGEKLQRYWEEDFVVVTDQAEEHDSGCSACDAYGVQRCANASVGEVGDGD